jgi:S-formylglutathione hydrolase FrmB
MTWTRVLIVAALLSAPPALASQSLPKISYTSRLLSEFWGRPTQINAKVFVPARCRRAGAKCAVLYHLPGYGGYGNARADLGDFLSLSASVPRLAMAHVLLDPNVNGGYSYFTDSPNNGPWETALVEEFIPYVEALLGVGGSPGSRFLAGYSSGGWTAVWLQVSNPDFFRGVWAISPDPLDFRHFYEVDVTPGSTQNFYFRHDGTPHLLMRDGSVTMKFFMQHDDVNSAKGGLISSYEFAWSPRGPDGLPLRLFARADGTLNEATLEAWQAFDVHAILEAGGTPLEDALKGKLHIYCGTDDDFFYDEPTGAICRFLQRNHYVAVCQLVPGRTHGSIMAPSNVYPSGLESLILTQVSRIFRREAAKVRTPAVSAAARR